MSGPFKDLTIERFESLLDAYGGDLARWPSPHAAAAEALLRQSPEARSTLAEARALDRLLGKTSMPDPARLALLAERIAARAAVEAPPRRNSSSSGPGVEARVIRLPQPPARTDAHVPVAHRLATRPPAATWRSTAALAASLLIGVAIGLTDIAQTTTLGIASLADAAATDSEVVISAVQLDTLNAIDEDQI